MSDPSGPTVRRRRLGSELRRLREKAEFDQLAAANYLECSNSKISRIELGQGLPKMIELRGLLDLYGVTDEDERAKMLEIRKEASEVGWWEQAEYETVLPSGLGVYVGLEYDARVVRAWELGYVPGLLQTEAYTRAVLSSSGLKTADDVGRLARVRMQRQERLTARSNPIELVAVVDEAALLRPVGGQVVMRDQLAHLLSTAELPNVTLQIHPLDSDAHAGMLGAFTLLNFGASDPVVGFVESPAGNNFLERARQTRMLVHTFDLLRAGALDPDESAARLAELATKE